MMHDPDLFRGLPTYLELFKLGGKSRILDGQIRYYTNGDPGNFKKTVMKSIRFSKMGIFFLIAE